MKINSVITQMNSKQFLLFKQYSQEYFNNLHGYNSIYKSFTEMKRLYTFLINVSIIFSIIFRLQ